ncbi:MAG: MFS transporter [Burkholderiales bacterium]
MSPSPPFPYRRLAALYFGYFVHIGAFAPYFSLYLQSIGQSALQIGLLFALMQLMRIGAPHLWAALADRRGWRARLLQATLAGALAVFAGVFATTSFPGLVLVLAGFAFFTSATMPLLDAITLAGLRDRVERYGGIRMWGSIGFIVAVLGAGWLLDRVAIANLRWILAVALALTCALSLTLRDAPAPGAAVHEPVLPLLVRRDVLVLLAANVLMNVAHGPLYAFFSIYLAQSGYGTTAIGVLWSLGVVAEIAIFLAALAWMKRFAAVGHPDRDARRRALRAHRLGAGVAIAAGLRPGAARGDVRQRRHVASVALVNQWFSGARQVRGQAVYLAAAFGFGGFVGACERRGVGAARSAMDAYTGAARPRSGSVLPLKKKKKGARGAAAARARVNSGSGCTRSSRSWEGDRRPRPLEDARRGARRGVSSAPAPPSRRRNPARSGSIARRPCWCPRARSTARPRSSTRRRSGRRSRRARSTATRPRPSGVRDRQAPHSADRRLPA